MKNIYKTGIALSATSFCALTYAQATGHYLLRVPTTENLSSWAQSSSIYGDWNNVGAEYGCSAWSPDDGSVDYGQRFLQSQTCNQDQQRQITHQEEDAFSGELRNSGSEIETRVQTVEHTRNSTGSRETISSAESEYTEWVEFDRAYSDWTPSVDSQTSNFNQSRSVTVSEERFEQQKQIRNGILENLGSPIRETRQLSDSESRTVSVSSSGWTNVDAPYDCSDWSPRTEDVDFGISFTQTRSCNQNTSNTYTFSADGSNISTNTDSKVEIINESQNSTGTKETIVSAESEWTEWSEFNTVFGDWSPVASNQITNFNQSRSVAISEERFEQQKQVRNGVLEDVGTPIRETRVQNSTESRTVTVTSTGWVNDGASYDCTDWSPKAEDIDSGQQFTQTRSCSQNKRNTYTFSIGGSHFSTDTETVTESNVATGTKPVSNNCSNPFGLEMSTYIDDPSRDDARRYQCFGGQWYFIGYVYY